MSPPPTRRAFFAAALALAPLLASCGGDASFEGEYDDGFFERALSGEEGVEAFSWLKDPHGGPKKLGGLSTDEGLAFAYHLQSLGAGRMAAVGITRHPGPGGYERASGLVVELPEGVKLRTPLFQFHASQFRAQGFAPQPDTGQKCLFFPWGTDPTP